MPVLFFSPVHRLGELSLILEPRHKRFSNDATKSSNEKTTMMKVTRLKVIVILVLCALTSVSVSKGKLPTKFYFNF